MRTSARWTGAAVAMTAALLVSGCGSSDDSGKDEKAPAEESGDTGGNGGKEADAKPGTVQGVWNTKVDGKDFVLSIAGDAATLARDEQFCTGKVTDAGKPTLTLKCPDGGGEERTNGTVESVEEKSLKVSWNGGDTDTFAKMADAPDSPDLKELEDLVPEG